jgi:phosphatidylglycerophosphate synthase
VNKHRNNTEEALSRITKSRQRTNILKKHEQFLIAFLVQRLPLFITSNMLTGIGLFGSFVTAGSFVLAEKHHRTWLLLGIIGLMINWFGDSLDGRLAYYRQTPRKWYGFSLDFIFDWFTNILIGAAYIYYVPSPWEMVGFVFVCLYGWAMMMALLRYKITNQYTIDSGPFGPTEVRILICLILVLETILPYTIIYSGTIICAALLVFNIKDFRLLLRMSDRRDKDEQHLEQVDEQHI